MSSQLSGLPGLQDGEGDRCVLLFSILTSAYIQPMKTKSLTQGFIQELFRFVVLAVVALDEAKASN